MKRLWLVMCLIPLACVGQRKQISIEDIFKTQLFKPETFAGFGSKKIEELLDASALKNDQGEQITVDKHLLSSDDQNILLLANTEAIYRRSTRSDVYLYDKSTKKIVPVNAGKVLHPTFSPSGKMLAYVFENNLYLYDIASAQTTAVTTDGKWNHIINGNCDWVYEEEFGFTQAYQWSPDGRYIAYYKFDESGVKEFSMTIYDSAYNKDYRFKYPKAGEENSKVSIHIYEIASAKTLTAEFEPGDIYIPRIKWASDQKLAVYWLNRHQNDLKLLLTDATSGKSTPFYTEANKYYVEINDNWHFLKDGRFIFTSEMNGYNQLYLYSIDGKKKIQLSNLRHDVTDIRAIDEKNNLVYYTLAYPNPLERHLFVTDFNGKNTKQLTKGAGTHNVEFNRDYSEYYDTYSTVFTPPVITRYKISRKKNDVSNVKQEVVVDNKRLRDLMVQYNFAKPEFIKVPNRRGDSLNAWILKPSDFSASKKYPVLFYNYGGPGSQYVRNEFGRVNAWQQLLAQKGFIVICVDNTGTGFRGEEFKKKTYLQLGKLEIEDQIDAATYMAKFPYVDRTRIGHYGWSYGGFLSSLAITRGADIFSAAVAVAPVTSWRFYDNIYTERYMRTPQENPTGYDENSPISHVDKIKGKYLIIHGTADDNVHFQNSVLMVNELIEKDVNFESAYYPNRAHAMRGGNAVPHIYSKMTNWLIQNLRDVRTSDSRAF
ncbi:MAG TPA: S9 family peptidase [Chitinophagaceae bacterium]|nr:S9 family peptidase [Chitinophagaceae bacterium]